MVVLVEEGVEADVEVVQRGDRAAEVQAALSERAPEALHLSARRGIVGLGVHQGGAHAGARQGQSASAVGGAVVQVHGVGGRMFANGAHEQAEHVNLALLVHRLDDDDVARGIVEQGVDAHGLFLAARGDQVRAVADVAVPEGAGALGLPAQSLLGVGPPARSVHRSRPRAANRRRTAEGETASLSMRPSITSVSMMSSAEALGFRGGRRRPGPAARA